MKRAIMVATLAVLGIASMRSAFFVVDETQFAIVTTFGKPVRTIKTAGPNWKLPAPIQSVLLFDKRLQVFDPRPTETFTLDRKNLVIDTFACWEIGEPHLFLSKAGSMAGAENCLAMLLASEMSAELGKHELSDLLSTTEDEIKLDAIVDAVTARCAETAERDYGISVVCTGIKRVNLPTENKQSVYERMRAEREQKARQYRAEGQEQATIIRAKTDMERRQILAAAYKEAQTLKGEGDAEALRIYAEAYEQAPEFYEFMRTLSSYETILEADTTVVLSDDSALLRLLTDFEPARVLPPAAAPPRVVPAPVQEPAHE
ncbi:MAG: protease modulator HflC [Candidatus Hydrogenedentes bacterium]|nr:protease modulator HflC [Candidatus Hydrogenedentota bacterium]